MAVIIEDRDCGQKKKDEKKMKIQKEIEIVERMMIVERKEIVGKMRTRWCRRLRLRRTL